MGLQLMHQGPQCENDRNHVWHLGLSSAVGGGVDLGRDVALQEPSQGCGQTVWWGLWRDVAQLPHRPLCELEMWLSHLGLGIFHAQQKELPWISGLQMFLGVSGVSTELPRDLWMVVGERSGCHVSLH